MPPFLSGKISKATIQRLRPQATLAFVENPTTSGKFLADIYQIAHQRLNKLGITQISGGDHCTYSEAEQFFSYRRDKQTGRMATLIWRSE